MNQMAFTAVMTQMFVASLHMKQPRQHFKKIRTFTTIVYICHYSGRSLEDKLTGCRTQVITSHRYAQAPQTSTEHLASYVAFFQRNIGTRHTYTTACNSNGVLTAIRPDCDIKLQPSFFSFLKDFLCSLLPLLVCVGSKKKKKQYGNEG